VTQNAPSARGGHGPGTGPHLDYRM
jgi:hypothetical protein